MPLSIRPATPQDAAAIARINSESFGGSQTAAEATALLGPILQDATHVVWVAEADGQPAGFLHACVQKTMWRPPFLEIMSLGSLPAFQRRGIARGLMEAAEAHAHTQQLAGVCLFSRMERAAAHRFYAALGYEEGMASRSFVKAFH